MKKLLYFAFFLFISNAALAQNMLLDSVITKLNKDKRALENFRVLGKLYSIDKMVGNSDVYFQCSATLYNTFDPFVRLVDLDSLAMFFKEINANFDFNYNNNHVVSYDSKKAYYNIWLHDITAFWNKRKVKTLYKTFIKNKKNYKSDDDQEEIEFYMRSYLNSYFIFIQTL